MDLLEVIMSNNSNKKRELENNTQKTNLDSFDMNKSLVQKIKEGEKEDISSMSTYNPHEEW